jgi:hypothetical protein
MCNTRCALKAIVCLLAISAQFAGWQVKANQAPSSALRSMASGVPPNDLLGNALKVNAQPTWVHTVSNQAASMESGEAFLRHGGETNAAASVWYTWSVRERTELLVDTAGSSFATAIGVYTGTSIATLVRVAGASSAVQGRDAWVRFVAEPNVSYKIAIAGIPPAQLGAGSIRFEVNGQPDLAAPLLEVSRPASGTTLRDARARIEGVAFDPQPNGSGLREVQYSLAIEGDAVTYTAQGTTNFAATIDLIPGLNGITLWALDHADNRSVSRRLSILYSPTISTNDLFVERFTLDPRANSRLDSSSAATLEPGEPAHAGNSGGASIWYEFSAQQSGVLLLSTLGSGFDTLLAVYQSAASADAAPSVTNLVELASSDDVPGGAGHSELTVTVEQGKKYFIAVDGFDGRSGTVQLTYRFSPERVFLLNVLPSSGRGTVSPAGGAYPENATVALLARPAEGSEFQHFETPSGPVTQNPLVLLMRSDVSVRAVFRAKSFSEDFEDGFTLAFDASGWTIRNDPTNAANHVFAAGGNRLDRTTNRVSLTLRVAEGIGSFDFGASCETNYDRLEFFVSYIQNGVESSRMLMSSWSGESRGRHQFAVRAGTVRLEWRFTKDAAISDGADSVFIDNLDLPLFTAHPVVSFSDDTIVLRLAGLGAQSLRVESSPDLANWTFVSTSAPDGSGEIRFTERSAGAARFYRFIPVVGQSSSSP